MSRELAIIGAGNMAEAIARGVIARGVFKSNHIIAADVSPVRQELFEKSLGIRAIEDCAAAVAGARLILLSVKPYQVQDVLKGLGPAIDSQALIVSIAAGISSKSIENALGSQRSWRVIRAMPNTPMLVGEGMVAIAPGTHATADDLKRSRTIFESAAKVIEVSEDQIDAVTAVSGSGPAYFFFLVEQMIQAGIEMGLSPDHARTLAIQTAVGAAKLMAGSSDLPSELRCKVTTPGGTTHAAISHMEAHDWPQITRDALKAAEHRSKEMGQK